MTPINLDKYSRQLQIAGFHSFEKEQIKDVFEGDIWNRNILIAESNFQKIQNQVKTSKPITLFLGYSPGRPHLGYLVMSKFVNSIRQYNKTKVILGINLKESMKTHKKSLEETITANKLVEKTLLGKDDKNVNRVYDLCYLNDLKTQKDYEEIYGLVSDELNFAKFNKLFGWDEHKSLSQYENICNAISGLLYSSIFEEDSIALTFIDLTHLPFAKLTKTISKKLGLQNYSYLISNPLPSLLNENERMKSTDEKASVFLFNEGDELKKYLNVRSGGKISEDQKKYGGNSNSCLALKIASQIIPSSETTKIVDECTQGMQTSCRYCKESMAKYINQEMNNL